jgi:transposase-like protein
MPRAVSRDPIYRGRRFSAETIELCVRWYITYGLSYRDLAAMMAEQGIVVSHTTIMRWVLQYVPEFEKRWARYARSADSSWRMDETAVSVRGRSHYLYRAVDRHGKSVDHLLRTDRGIAAAQAFFRKAVATNSQQWPRKINLDGNTASHRALRILGEEDPRWKSVVVQGRRYLNNIVEQDHRAIKRRCALMLGFKSFRTAEIILAGIELAHRIHKQQFSLAYKPSGTACSLKEQWDRALGQGPDLLCPEGTHPPSTHQNSARQRRASLSECPHGVRTGRSPRKISYGRSLYLLEMPNGGRYWRYAYRFSGRQKTLALGVFPDVPLESAMARHQEARSMVAAGVDPSVRKQELKRQQRFPWAA